MDILQNPPVWNQNEFAPEGARTPPPGPAPEPPPTRPRRIPWLAVAGTVLLIGAVLWGTHRGSDPTPGVAQEVVGKYHVLLHEYPDRPWLRFSKAYRDFLGDPLWSEQPYQGYPDCVGYENAIVCISSDPRTIGSIWEFEPLPLGLESLKRTRKLPQPGAAEPAIVERYLQNLAEDAQAAGETDLVTQEDIVQFWFGRAEREPECVAGLHGGPGQCLQVFDRAVVRWPQGSEDPRDVQLWPLGTEAPRP